jgi:hypothetical protein
MIQSRPAVEVSALQTALLLLSHDHLANKLAVCGVHVEPRLIVVILTYWFVSRCGFAFSVLRQIVDPRCG